MENTNQSFTERELQEKELATIANEIVERYLIGKTLSDIGLIIAEIDNILRKRKCNAVLI